MDGVSYITDEKGKKNAVVIDLKKHSKVWEDMYDSIIADNRVKEPKESYESVKEKMKKRKRLIKEVKEAESEYKAGKLKPESVNEIIKAMDKVNN